MRILVDMNLTTRQVEYLNGAGHEACHWSPVGSASAKDREICEYARTNWSRTSYERS
jgi:predicted nuclease of predicted toxin-antitoxin system